jgi:hypothetical protein
MTPEHLKVRYEENAKIAAIFFDWRHKLMTFTFAAVSALVVVCGWLVTHQAPRGLVATPLGVAVAVAVAATAMDRRLGKIMKCTYVTGRDLEGQIAPHTKVGIYSQLYNLADKSKWGRLSIILPIVYGTVAIRLAVLAGCEVVSPLHTLK